LGDTQHRQQEAMGFDVISHFASSALSPSATIHAII
jgi:hypothetical protein